MQYVERDFDYALFLKSDKTMSAKFTTPVSLKFATQ